MILEGLHDGKMANVNSRYVQRLKYKMFIYKTRSLKVGGSFIDFNKLQPIVKLINSSH